MVICILFRLKDRFGETQIVAKKGDCPDSVLEQINLKRTLFISSKGTRKTSTKVANRRQKSDPIEAEDFFECKKRHAFYGSREEKFNRFRHTVDLRAVDSDKYTTKYIPYS